jgi:hypothetical protein
VTLTFSVAAQAVQNVRAVNVASVNYALAPGTNSAPVTLVANEPVFLMGVQTNVGFRGVGQVALLSIPGGFLEWVGLDSTAGSVITQGFSGAAGTKIVFLDFSHCVQVQVDSSTSFAVRNNCGIPAAGSVTLIW